MVEHAASIERLEELTPERFQAWVAPHLRAMALLAARLAPEADRDDVVQEALARAWVKRSTFDPGRGSPSAWLLAITADKARRARRGRRPLVASIPTRVHPSEDRLDLEEALLRLSARQRVAVDCFYFVGLSVVETAAVMRCSEGTVKSTLHDARSRLKILLEVE